MVILSSEANKFCTDTENTKFHWVKFFTLLTMFPYSVIPKEPKSNPVSEGFRVKLDSRSFNAGKRNKHTHTNGTEIHWSHLKELYDKNRAQANDSGLALLPKIKFEHVHLTSYSKMRVDLGSTSKLIT